MGKKLDNKTPVKNEFKPIVHWMTCEPYHKTVFVLIGPDVRKCCQRLEAVMRPCWSESDIEGLVHTLETDPLWECKPAPQFCRVGRTVINADIRDPVIWFPRFPCVEVLIHELLHGVQEILERSGVQDKNGEADAYLLGALVKWFYPTIKHDIETRLGKDTEWPA